MRWWRGGGSLLRKAAAPPCSSRRTAADAYHTIQAVPREYTGCRVAAKERAQGRIPCAVFNPNVDGSGPVSRKQLLTTETKQIQSILKQSPFFCSTVFNLQVRAGPGSSVVIQSGNVLPIKVHKNEETGQILNLVMAWAEKGLELKVDVPVVYKGVEECPGLKKGGYLQKLRTSLKYLCPTEHIPEKIEVDLTKVDIGDRVSMHDVEVHPSLKLLSKNDTMPICKILSTKREPKATAPEATQTSETTEA